MVKQNCCNERKDKLLVYCDCVCVWVCGTVCVVGWCVCVYGSVYRGCVCVCGVLTVTGGSILCTLLSSISISLALAQRFFTSFSLIISHRRNCSICLYGNYTICSMINQCNVLWCEPESSIWYSDILFVLYKTLSTHTPYLSKSE